jgi:hypothetical protein
VRLPGIEEAVDAAALEPVREAVPGGEVVTVRARLALVGRRDLHQRRDPLGPRERERHCRVSTHRRAADRRPVGAQVVENGAQVLDEVAVLVRVRVGSGGGLAMPARVERREPVARARQPLRPHDRVAAGRREAVHQHHVRPRAERLTGDRGAAGLELEGFGTG